VNWLQQILSISLMNLRSIPARLGPSMVIIVGIAGVVTVLVALLAMAKGFESTLGSTGKPDRVIIMRGGSTNEMSSGMAEQARDMIAEKPGIARDERGTLAGGETYIIADIRKRGNNSEANLPMRGVTPRSMRIRDEVTIIEGRDLQPGKWELIAGQGAANQFVGLDLGSEIKVRDGNWRVVGIFSSGGSVYESEVWVDNAMLQTSINRQGGISSVIARLESRETFSQLEKALEEDPRLETMVVREDEYYSEQSTDLNQLITGFGYLVASIMAIGAVFGALNSMYSAVSVRSVEIATLRALGFGAVPVVFSVMLEAMLLALTGGILGAAIAYLLFNGYTVSTLNNTTFSQVAFDFAVTIDLMQKGIIWSCLLGLIGGLLPAIRAARLPITVALRGL